MEVGDKLNPQRSYRKGFALKGLHQHIIKTNNPSAISPDELLTVRFLNLKENQVIIPSTTKLTFNISLEIGFWMSIKQIIWLLTLVHLWIRQRNQTKDSFTELSCLKCE